MFDEGTVRAPRGGHPVKNVLVRAPDREIVAEAVTVGTADGNSLVLADPLVSRYHVEIAAGANGATLRDLGSTNGTFCGAVRLRGGEVDLTLPATIQIGRTTLAIADAGYSTVPAYPEEALGQVRGRSQAMRRAMDTVRNLAPKPASVLIYGESGTGKELIARALHELSPRSSGPFVIVDCGTFSPQLVQSELFGHERGAFTGADRKHAGAFERAHGGTLFLDEIGELPAEIQPALLGALARRTFRRVGGQQDLAVDFRLVTATHRDLRRQVNDGRFRLDLYYRIAVVTLRMPALRERPEDIPLLLEHFLRSEGYEGELAAILPPERLAELITAPWEGNVRELRNYATALLAMGDAPIEGAAAPIESTQLALYRDARRVATDAFERAYVTALMSQAGGNIRQAARIAGMDRGYLVQLIERHGLRARSKES